MSRHPFTCRVTVAPDVLFRLVGEEAVLLNLETELYLGLDAVGTRMWTVLTESPSIQAAYDVLREEYDVDPERLIADVAGFLGKLEDEQLVEIGLNEPVSSDKSQ